LTSFGGTEDEYEYIINDSKVEVVANMESDEIFSKYEK
jgi:hypothetical protein